MKNGNCWQNLIYFMVLLAVYFATFFQHAVKMLFSICLTFGEVNTICWQNPIYYMCIRFVLLFNAFIVCKRRTHRGKWSKLLHPAFHRDYGFVFWLVEICQQLHFSIPQRMKKHKLILFILLTLPHCTDIFN